MPPEAEASSSLPQVGRYLGKQPCNSLRPQSPCNKPAPFTCPGADLLKMSRDDLVQICGPADGIRLFNAIKGR